MGLSRAKIVQLSPFLLSVFHITIFYRSVVSLNGDVLINIHTSGKIGKIKITVVDWTGKIVHEQQFKNQDNPIIQEKLNLNHLNKGFYLVNIKSGQETKSKKLIIH